MIFPTGSTVVRRDILDGKVFAASPHRVLHDTDDELLLAYWPGITSLSPKIWTQWLRTGDDSLRAEVAVQVAARNWELDEWVRTARLSWFGVDEWFSLHRFYDLDGTVPGWYVNFERPVRRTAAGIETFDLAIDLVTTPDLSEWHWKDEDEYEQLQELGGVTPDEIREIEAARERAVRLIESRGGPLAQDWDHWRPDPAWPLPVLPEGSAQA